MGGLNHGKSWNTILTSCERIPLEHSMGFLERIPYGPQARIFCGDSAWLSNGNMICCEWKHKSRKFNRERSGTSAWCPHWRSPRKRCLANGCIASKETVAAAVVLVVSRWQCGIYKIMTPLPSPPQVLLDWKNDTITIPFQLRSRGVATPTNWGPASDHTKHN